MLIVAFEDIRSVYNVGSIFRTMEGFGFSKAALIGITPTPIDKNGLERKDFHKTALGSLNNISWEYFSNTRELIDKYPDYKIISVELSEESRPIEEMSLNKDENYVLVFGSEVDGVKNSTMEKSTYVFHIPMFGKKESFNVSVAAGIVLYEIKKQQL